MNIHKALPIAAALLACCIAIPALASEQASAQLTSVSLGGGDFAYTIDLTNTGTTNIETFWYAWIPGQDYMPVSPTNIQQPANWTDQITGGSPGGGYAIQWVTSSSVTPAPLAPGSSFDFTFDSTATPATLAGNATFAPSTPIGTSFIYGGGPFSDPGYEFVVNSVPEPSTLLLLPLGAILMICAARRQTKKSIIIVAAIFLCAAKASTSMADESAAGQVTSTALGNGVYEYTITLTNTGSVNLETFWFAWLPGDNFMPVSPTNIQSPANWTAKISHQSDDGYAIQWVTASSATPAPLTPGASLVFSFDSTATPDVLAGDSSYYPGTPTLTSIVYGGAPFSDSGAQLVLTSSSGADVVSIAATRAQTAEAGGAKGVLIVTRSGDDSADLTVNYKTGGTAVSTQYKALSGTVVIPAGKKSAKIKVKAIDDHIAEGNTVLSIKLTAGNGYTLGKPAKAKVSIIDAGL